MTWSKEKRSARAGKRRCRRCKVLWYREKGDTGHSCVRCRSHCNRCDTELTVETKHKTTGYICKACHRLLNYDTSNEGKMKKTQDNYLVRTYGITLAEYDAILKEQGGGCWICGASPSKEQRRLSVDHLHSKGEKKRNLRERRDRIRGLLCGQCNRAIGKFKDDVTKLRRAADYLEQWPGQQVLKKEAKDE